METLKKNLANLLKVKTIVTILLTVVFCVLALTGEISSADFLTVFAVVIAFYFGTQTQKTAQDGGTSGKTRPTETVTEQMDGYTGNEMQPEAMMDTLQPPDEMHPVGFKY